LKFLFWNEVISFILLSYEYSNYLFWEILMLNLITHCMFYDNMYPYN